VQSGSVHLRHDPDAAVVVTEVLQLYISICGAVDTAVVAYLTAFGAEDTAFLEPGTVDTAFGAWTATVGVLPQKTCSGCAQLLAPVRCI